MKTYSSDALKLKYTFESLYILCRFGILNPIQGINRKEKKLIRNGVLYMKNDQ